jgi:hydrogenase maturation protease
MSARVIALGQPAAGDDGVGWAVLDAIDARGVPDGVELVRAREASAILPHLVGRVVVVDAVVGASRPGEVRVLVESELDAAAPSSVSSHGIGVVQALALARELGQVAAISIVAVGIGAPRRYAMGLSPEVAAAVPRAADTVLQLLHHPEE